uniref:Uncharacterized protein n=1 Tax=Pyrodinium bahamense TaxID=73915 RepID=A0A7S0B752_9DINO|mmetsp:Transcript_52172/g.144449  ORF Transcript_52172/g.144449 Transcript_52172/m.144449 type:complete len:439 (+) Transcript_52172:1-1317(+)
MDFMRPQVSPAVSSVRLFWKIVAFVLPSYTFVLMGTLMSAVDKAFIGQVSSVQLASLGPAAGSYDMSAFSLSFLAQATLSLLAAPPQGLKREVLRSHAVVFAALAGALLGTCLAVFAVPVVRAFGASEEMVPHALAYLRVRALCMFLGRTRDIANQFCLAEKDAITPFLSTLVAVVVNVTGDLLLCERFGTLGAAVATDAASAAALGFVVTRLRHRSLWPRPVRAPTREDFAPFAEYAGPIFLNNLSKMAAIMLMAAFATRMGTSPGAAHQICIAAWLLCGFTLGMPLSWAARAFLPANMQDGEYHRTARVLFAVTAAASAVGAGLAHALLRFGLGLFTRDPLVKMAVAEAAPSVVLNVLLCVYYQSMEGIMITQKRLHALVRLGASLTAIFCVSSFVLYEWGSLTLPLLWATLSAGVLGICTATTMIVVDGLRKSRP